MKKMNRREFLALTGAAVVALSLAGCDADDVPPAAPPAPPAPTTSEETKVLEAIKKYRAAAGVTEQITRDDGLKPAAELVVKIAKGDVKFGDAMGDPKGALNEAMKHYNDLSAPIGIAFDPDTGDMTLLCVYSEDVEKMAKELPLRLAADTQEDLKSARLIAIQVFESERVKYWVALVAKGKVAP